MKHHIFTIILTFMCIASSAQIKLHSNGQVSLGTTSGSWLNSMQVSPNGGCVHFNSSPTTDWHWVTVATPNAVKGKCWIVTYPNDKYDHRFFVTGNGYLWKRGSWRASDRNLQEDTEAIERASEVLDELTGIWYIPIGDGNKAKTDVQRRAGVIAQDVQKVLPEAVTTDENGMLYVDYETFTVFLIQAFKEQNARIEQLETILEENGLLKP